MQITPELTFLADSVYKASKSESNGDVKTKGHPTVENEEDLDDLEAGPELPPEDDLQPDDEDGRFFGAGVSRSTANLLDFIEERDKDDAVLIKYHPL